MIPSVSPAAEAQSSLAVRHGAYVCLRVPVAVRQLAAARGVQALADSLDLRNEFVGLPEDEPQSIAYLRRVEVQAADLADDGLANADAVVHVAASNAAPVARFCAEVQGVLGPEVEARVLSGVVVPKYYTSRAMHDFAYANRVLPRSGTAMPNAFIVPMRKTDAWWAKGWMERHTYFLPRFDDAGRMLHEGHALAAEAGIACLLRRTYKHPVEPAPTGAYDFVSYFECADADVPTFNVVCAALRDIKRNPEWTFVQEGPTWHGRRVATWRELFD